MKPLNLDAEQRAELMALISDYAVKLVRTQHVPLDDLDRAVWESVDAFQAIDAYVYSSDTPALIPLGASL